MFTGNEAIFVEMVSGKYHGATNGGKGIVNEGANLFFAIELAGKSDVFKQWAENGSFHKSVYDAKATLVSLLNYDIHMKGITFDLLLASYLLNPSDSNQDIPAIGHRLGETNVLQDEAVYGKGAKIKVPEHAELANHIVRKTRIIFALRDEMMNHLEENEQFDLYKELEMPLALILGEMEHRGVKINTDRLKEMGTELESRLTEIEKDVYELAGEEFNLNSPKQLGPILFEKLELPVIKRTKTGYSTAADVLEKLEGKHDIIPKITIYRQLRKLLSTYVDGLLKVVDQDRKNIHTRFNQALTQTGRLSSIEPNLQNIPIRMEEGRKIRQAFIPAKEDWVIFAADYSQIELRVLAHIA